MPDEDCTEITGIPAVDLVAIATSPESMKNGQQEYTERSVDDLIKLDEYLRARRAACDNPAAAGWGRIITHKVVPPDTVGSI